MATRVDKTSGLSQTPEATLVRSLRSKSGKRRERTDFIGLKRSGALSDVSDPRKSLNNTLEKINQNDVEEQQNYNSTFDSLDWAVTKEFALEGITKDHLEPLFGVSSGESGVNLTPRVRIEDRISQVDSFCGIDSFNNFHGGPNAQFYRLARRQNIGSVKFSFDIETGDVTVSEILSPNGIDILTEEEILGDRDLTILLVESYELEGGQVSSLSGSDIYLELDTVGGWRVFEGIENLISVKSILGDTRFSQRPFSLAREYSSVNLPPWFKESPSTGIPDEVENLVKNSSNTPYVAKGYWYSKAVVEDRWSPEERRRISVRESNLVQDSNMRWESLPTPLRSEIGGWGIRWDGYLYITSGIYAFQVETNSLVKIDIFLDQWTNVFETDTSTGDRDKYVSSETFNSDDIDDKFKYFKSESEWEAYIPITIRMYVGGADKSAPNLVLPSEPDLFIKTTQLSTSTSFYSKRFDIEITDQQIFSEQLSELLDIVTDENSSVSYALISQDGVTLDIPIPVEVSLDGEITSPVVEDGEYVLEVLPDLSTEFVDNLKSLWRGRIASPQDGKTSYADLVSGEFSPNQEKVPYELRPTWWKVSGGNPYNLSLPVSPGNNPFDGFALNTFKDVFNSGAGDFGLYGNGEGEYTERPNIILGESRFSGSDPEGSNYTGIVISPNRFGEGGNIVIDAFPINNSVFDDTGLLGENELGGDPNHKTSVFDEVESNEAQIYLWTSGDEELQGKYYLHPNIGSITSSDDPTAYGLPAFSSPEWLSPITISAVQVCDNSSFTGISLKSFVAPLPITLERVNIPEFSIISFSVSLGSLLPGGSEVSQFSGKFVRYYTSDNSAFQYRFVDTGESLSFSDVLKFTYNTEGKIIPSQSEIPQPPSERVSPFGFDGQSGICYPPYTISDPALDNIAIEDEDLYNSPSGWYDVFWGDRKSINLGGKTLTVTNSFELRGSDAVEVIENPLDFNQQFYTHKFKVSMPLEGDYDEDVKVHIGSGEQVSDLFYLFANVGIEPLPDPVIPDPEEVLPLGPDPGEGLKPGTIPLTGFEGDVPEINPPSTDIEDGPGEVIGGNLADLATITSTENGDEVFLTNTGAVAPLGSFQSYETG
jgi:hypothetical protein